MEDETRGDRYTSIIITSNKEEIKTLRSLDSTLFGEVIISRLFGLGHARNAGARRAKGDFYVFFDDDLVLDPKIWNELKTIKHGEFGMTFLSGFPFSRCLAIYREDFWSIGGFDENIKFTGEDRDFYVRALNAGFKFKRLPLAYVKHQPHITREKNIHVAISMVRENMAFVHRYGYRHPEVLKVDVWDRLKKGQLRTLLLQFLFFELLIFKNLGRR